jgi:hypothetical protein
MPLEVPGFCEIEIDQISMDEEPDAAEDGPLEPDPALEAIAKPGDLFAVGRHRIACGDARDPALLARLMASAEARLVLTDVPYNVPIKGHVSGQNHREFAMASGEMSSDEFLAFNQVWIEHAGRHLVEGGVMGTFIDWRGYPAVHAAATAVGLTPLNLVVWSKTNAGMGSLYRSAHELLPLFKNGKAAHVNNVELGRHGRWRSNVWTYPGSSSRLVEGDLGAGDAEDVAVGRSGRNEGVACKAAAARPVDHGDRNTELLLEPISENARDRVDATARRPRRDDLHRSVGERRSAGDQTQEGAERQDDSTPEQHEVSSFSGSLGQLLFRAHCLHTTS